MPLRADEAFAAVMLITGGRCAYCGMRIWPVVGIDRNHTTDHVIPRSAGGSDELSNRLPCCRRCNSVKGDRPLDDARHNFALLAASMPPFTREQIAWMRSHGTQLERYDSFRFWFESHKTRHIEGWSDDKLRSEIKRKSRRLAAL